MLILSKEMQAFMFYRYTLIITFGYIAAVCDIKTRRVPNAMVLIMMGAWAVTIVPYLLWDLGGAVTFIKDAVSGFLTGGLLFMFMYIVSRKGIGGGDVKFIAAAGLYMGFVGTLVAILSGLIFAGFAALVLMLFKKIGRKDALPMVPFLYAGILVALFIGFKLN